MSPRVAEATAPCRVELAGGPPGTLTLAVAIDRRAWCRVESGVDGIEIESRDGLRKASGRDLSEIRETGALGAAGEVLRGLGVNTGLRVVTQSRVPAGSGLGESRALAVAMAGAAVRVLGTEPGGPPVAAAGRMADGGPDGEEGHAAVVGGAIAVHPGSPATRVERLSVDPARIEQCLLLIEAGGEAPRSLGDRGADAIASVARGVREALLAGRFEDVVGLWADEWECRSGASGGSGTGEVDRVASLVREAGGGVRACAAGRGRVLAVWAPPGERGPGRKEAVLSAARAAGLRLFPARVDLRGLEVE